ncbi:MULTISPECIES: helix-turn-helix transcriptional regulator [Microbacterium]|uniref:LuxR family transcriptional regulator n=1 Tax=Microbacterium wangchenii TaxID=2541726 RepID=A0ABX5STF2_9MICO|nr:MULTISPECIES: LuxR family transcriptional regulator [Microbacterium]MCK6067623.1 LuxR C-terminal-related transcriptional regulator [Microbacterium sp. EYE_512]QBR89453.1 LuxR family transcriptional regulator [Microbacterium wangchenii]TXK11126.1 helix-turn-helix transcriptional regulator [Microbacterium wangchenii]
MGAATVPNEQAELVSHAVGELARRTRFPVAFGGLERDGAIHVTAIHGARTRSIEGLVVQENRGLGGRAFAEKRPRLALDYRTSRTITHDYDRAILGEGISTLFAVPIVVTGTTRGVLYCGSWTQAPVGDVVAEPAFRVARELATELRVRDEVDRRIAMLPSGRPDAALSPAAQEEVRESYAELRSVAAAIEDESLRVRLEQVERRLAALTGAGEGAGGGPEVRLSPRELDVLACAALGATNSEIAHQLDLKETTVKSYLAAAMSKLDASTRHAAVARARRIGILP